MKHIYADDGRILTSPKELKPLLKNAFLAFSKLLGHIRFYFMADEIWDGRGSLIFKADGEQLAAIILADDIFYVQIAGDTFHINDETALDAIFEALKKTIPDAWHRPLEQRTVHPDPNVYPCGYRCDLCLGSKSSDADNYPANENFGYMNWLCYHNCVPGIDIDRWDGVFRCSGCTKNNNQFCRSFTCSKEKGFANCAQCGEYHSCDIYHGSHYAGQCNLGITAEEVTLLVIPYCMKERLDTSRNNDM